ncbi:MAG: hypothetical protein ACXWX5_11905 [Actinomycetota bacterium]
MQDADLYMELAGIAGVFVGFGALIAVRGGGASDAFEVSYMRGVVSFGLLTIVAALAPVTLGRYDLAEHQVWALSSVVVLVGLIAVTVLNASTPEYWDETAAPTRSRWLYVLALVGIAFLMLAAALAPIVIILNLAPGVEAALFFTAVVVILLFDAWQLLQMVFRRRHPATA